MDLTPIFVVGIVFLVTYKIFELLVRRKERMAIIEKYDQLPKTNKSNSHFIALRIGLLLLGLGIGLVGSTMLWYGLSYSDVLLGTDLLTSSMQDSLTNGMVLLWGGMGLFVAFLIERRAINKQNKANNQNNQ